MSENMCSFSFILVTLCRYLTDCSTSSQAIKDIFYKKLLPDTITQTEMANDFIVFNVGAFQHLSIYLILKDLLDMPC